MDLTWDDTSDNWYGDLDQRHLYFGLTDELMTIAHSDHTANYQMDDYAYRSTDLSNNYFVRNGKADEWAEKYADRIQQHLDAKEESFSIDADNQSFPPSISGIQNGTVAYAMNQREWKVQGAKAELTAASNVSKESNSKWSARYDLAAKYRIATLEKVIDDGSYRLAAALDARMAVSASASGCSLSSGAGALSLERDGPLQGLLGRPDADRVGQPGGAGRGGRLRLAAVARLGPGRRPLLIHVRLRAGAGRPGAADLGGQHGMALRAQRGARPGVGPYLVCKIFQILFDNLPK